MTFGWAEIGLDVVVHASSTPADPPRLSLLGALVTEVKETEVKDMSSSMLRKLVPGLMGSVFAATVTFAPAGAQLCTPYASIKIGSSKPIVLMGNWSWRLITR